MKSWKIGIIIFSGIFSAVLLSGGKPINMFLFFVGGCLVVLGLFLAAERITGPAS